MARSAAEPAGYDEWRERQGTTALFIYALLIVTLMPGFHFALTSLADVPPDSLALRLAVAGISLSLAIAVALYRPLRRYADRLQVLNVLPTYVAVMILIVDSRNHFMYLASGLLVVVGCQYAFLRVRDLALTFAVGFIVQVAYSWYRGLGADPVNHVALFTYASAIFITLLPAYFRMRSHREATIARLEAQDSRAELQRQLAREKLVLQISDFIRSSFDLQEILANVARALGTETRCDRLAIALWSESDESMIFRSEYRRDERMPTLIGIEMRSRQWQHIYRVLLGGQSLHVPDIASYRLTTRQRQVMQMTATLEFAAIPILNRQQNRLLGMITMGIGGKPGRLTTSEISLCEAIASQVAIAIQQSQVYAQLQLELEHRRLQEERLSNLANRDALTGVYNRRYFIDFLRRSLDLPQTEEARGALLYCDLDRFKTVNDSLGHDAGDRLLVQLCKIIRGALRENDLLARMGGDEFSILLPSIRRDDAIAVAEKVRKSIEGFRLVEGGRVFDIGISIGVVLLDQTAGPEVMLTRADEACYAAKHAGRNTVKIWAARS